MFEALSGILNQGLAYIIPMIVLLGLLVFVHELGHFLAAKFYGVRVETFSLGFGPKIIKFLHKETVYCVSALPLGGYVKMYGDEPGKDIPEEQKKQSYLHKPVGQRIVITLAGPLMNLFFAAVLFVMIAFIGDKALAPEVGEIAENSRAYSEGFRPFDHINKIDGVKVNTWDEVKEVIENSGGETLSFAMIRDEKEITLATKAVKSENDNLFSTADKIGKIKGLHSNLHFPIVGIDYGGDLFQAGLRTGDRIVEVNGESVEWYKDIEPMIMEALYNGAPEVSLKIHRFPDFRENKKFNEHSFKLEAKNFTDHKLDMFVPETVIAEVQEDSPADKAGLKRLDRIVSINGEKIISFDDIVANVSSYEQGQGPLDIKVIRDNKAETFQMVPKMNELEGRYGETENRFTIGVIPTLFMAPKSFQWKSDSLGEALTRSWEQTLRWTNVTIMSFVRIVQNRVSSKNISGIISIGQVAQKSWSIGLNAFLKMMAIISINLFIINLFPIPILDGGHLLIFTLEAIKGAPLSLKKIEMAQQVGFLIILFLMAFALFNDFSRIFGS